MQADAKYKILIIEDDAFLRELIVKKFTSSGFAEIDKLESGRGALEKIRSFKPNVVLLDLIMPEVDGYEVLKSLRHDEDIKDTPVIALTNLGQQSEIDKCVGFGCVDFLVKAANTPQNIVNRAYHFLEGREKDEK